MRLRAECREKDVNKGRVERLSICWFARLCSRCYQFNEI